MVRGIRRNDDVCILFVFTYDLYIVYLNAIAFEIHKIDAVMMNLLGSQRMIPHTTHGIERSAIRLPRKNSASSPLRYGGRFVLSGAYKDCS